MQGISKSARLYEEIRAAVLGGRYAPGARIDPAALASEAGISPTPVKFALYRLVGEGIIAAHAGEGFHVPQTNEVALRQLYDWMQRLLVMACDMGFANAQQNHDVPQISPRDGDVVLQTRELFETIAAATHHHCLYLAVRHTNDRLESIRRAKQPLIQDAPEELARLRRFWLKGDRERLRAALVHYHERRKRLVPHIVGLLDTLARAQSGTF